MPARHRSAKIEVWFFNLNSRGKVMDKVTAVGIDLAVDVRYVSSVKVGAAFGVAEET